MFTVRRSSRSLRAIAAAAAILVAGAGLSLVTAQSASADGAGQAFDCTVPTYFSEVSDGTNAQLYKGTYAASGATTWTAFGPQAAGAANNYNALGYNPVDKYLYALVLDGTIMRIDSAGALTTVGTTNPALGSATTLWDSGTFGPDGTYYVANAYAGGTALKLHKITNITTTRTNVTVSLPDIRFADLVYKDGYLWAHNYNQTSTIYRIDPSTGTVVNIASPLPVGAYGAEFLMGNGNLSWISASTMYQVQINNSTSAAPTATLITSYAATANTRADATNCSSPAADLQITKTGPSTVAPSATITWNIAVTNAGPGASSGFVVQDALPAGLTNVTATSAGASCTITGQSIVCNNAALAVAATRNITVSATAPSAVGSIVNTATVVGNEADPGAGPNSSSITTAVAVAPAAVNDNAGSLVAGATKTFTTASLLSNDTGTGITYTSNTQPSHGAITQSGGNLTYTPAAGYAGADSFTYTITGSGGGTASATVSLTVTPIAPAAVDDNVGSVTAGSTKTVATSTLLSNDTGTGISFTSFSQPAHGSITQTGGNLVYTPTAGYSGSDAFTYTITGQSGATSTANVTLTVVPIAPDAVDDNAGSLVAGATKSITRASLLANDTGTGISVTSFSAMSAHGGTITSTGGGNLVYTPAAGYSGPDSFTYTITGSGGGTDTATVSVTVTPVATDAVDDNAGSVVAGSTKTISKASLLSNDTGTAIAFSSNTQPAHGAIATDASGNLVYTPAAGFSGADSFTYTITGPGGTDTATVSLTVTPVATDAVDDNAGTVTAGSTKTITKASLLSNDSGTAIAFSSNTQPAHGTITTDASGNLVYTPAAGYAGADSFTYTITGPGGTDTATVSITVAPITADAVDDNAGSLVAGSSKTITKASLLSNDTGTGIGVTSNGQPAHGTVTTDASGNLVYTPSANYSGADSFTYTITATGGSTDTATVSLSVTPIATDAVDDNAGSLVAGASKTITKASLLSNDTGTAIAFSSNTQPGHGAVTTDASGNLVYTPAVGYAGPDSFTYTITGPGGTDTATVSLTVTPVTTKAVNDNAGSLVAGTTKTITKASLLANDSGTAIAFSSNTQPAHGAISTDASGNLVYTPAAGYSGADSFTYTITGPGGTDTATVSVTVTPVATDAVDDNAGTVTAGSTKTITKASLLSNDSGTAIAFSSNTQPAHGAITTDASGNLVYAPTAGYTGADSFTYTITGPGGTDTATVSITVAPLTADAIDDNAGSVVAGSTKTITKASLLNNDIGTGVTFTSNGQPAHGTITTDASGNLVYTPTTGYTGPDSFVYSITATGGSTDTATVSLTVTPVATDAVDDNAGSLVAGSSKTITKASLLSNDTGTAIVFSSTTQPAHGSVTTDASGNLVYAPTAGFSGIDSFTYTITGPGGTDTATVSLTVTPVATDAVDDNAGSLVAGGSKTITKASLLSNDTGTAVAFSSNSQPAHGTITPDASGNLVYTPAANYSGADSFTYTITGPGGTDTATVSLNVTPIAADAVDDNAGSVNAGSSATITRASLLSNDTGTAISFTSFAQPGHGAIVTNGAGELVYTPAANYSGPDAFSYSITGAGGTDSATVSISVVPVAPDAVNDTVTATAGGPTTITRASLLSNDTGTAISFTSFTQPNHGTVATNGAGELVYTPAVDYSGPDVFTYTITGAGGTDTANVAITVVPVAPDAVDDTASTGAGSPVIITRSTLLSNDTGTAISVTGHGQPSNGTVTTNGAGDLVYTPAGGFSGTDSFTYTITGAGGTDTANVSVTVSPAAVVAPHAVDDSATVSAGSSLTLPDSTLTANDTGTGIAVTATTSPSHGTLARNGAGNLVYTPTPGYSGADSFTYTISNSAGSSTATVALTVTPVAPDAVDDSTTAVSGVATAITRPFLLSNDSGTVIAVSSFTQPGHGTVTSSGGDLTYTSVSSFSGADTFTYTITGPGGTDTATVHVSVSPVAPHAVNDAAGSVFSGSTKDITTASLLANDTGTAIAFASFTQPGHGSLTTDPSTGDLLYTPTGSYTGADSFTYTITGPIGSSTATVSLTVAPLAPTAVDDAASTSSDTDLTITRAALLANDSGTAIAVTGFTQPVHGTVSTDASGNLVYQPTPGFAGSDSFHYTITGSGGTASATVAITVTPIAPQANDDTVTTVAQSPATITRAFLTGNDTGTAIAVTGFAQPTHGTVTQNAAGELVYTSGAYVGADTFTYTITGPGGTSTADVHLNVTAAAPDAVDDTVAATAGTPTTIPTSTLLANDTGTLIVFSTFTQPSHGTITTNPAGDLVYTPNGGFSGADTFTYTITGPGGSDTATVTITNAPVAPHASDDVVATVVGTAVTITKSTMLSNDTGTAITVTSFGQGANGGVADNGAGGLIYTPVAGFSGSDSFTYLISGPGGTDSARVIVTIAPLPVNDAASTGYLTAVPISVLANDQGTNRTVTGASNGAHGAVAFTATGVTYTPAAGFSGTDSFSYTLTADGGSGTGFVTVTVHPLANDDTAATTAGAAVAVSVLANDKGLNRSVTAASNGAHGAVTFTASGVTYTPAAGFSGTDSFPYTLTADGGTDTADVVVTVTPTAATDRLDAAYATATTIDPRGNDVGTLLTVSAASSGAHGTVTFTSTGVTYTPTGSYSGADSFAYTVTDSSGQSVSSIVTVLVHPSAPDDAELTTVGVPVTVDVLANDGGTGLVLDTVTTPTHGTATIVGGKVLYTPAGGFSGIDTFQYASHDGSGTVAGATVTIYVNPVAQHDTATAGPGAPVTLSPLGNDAGTSLSVDTASVPAAQGVVTIQPGGTLSFTPAAAFSGAATVSYSVVDPDGLTSAATITVVVSPLAVPDSEIVTSSPQVISVLSNDSGSGLRLMSITPASHGLVRMVNNTVTYTPDPGFVGGDLFTYALQDGFGSTSTTTVSLTVTALASTVLLAHTGVDPASPALAALTLLVLGGIFFVLASRRRPRGRHL